MRELVEAGARSLVNLSASPWHVGKAQRRRRMIADLATRHDVPCVFVNQVGGNDELIFDGASFAMDRRGRVLAALPYFEPGFAVVDLEAKTRPWLQRPSSIPIRWRSSNAASC